MGGRRNVRWKRFSGIAILCLTYSLFVGWTGDLKKFGEEAKSVQTLSADFVQEKNLKILVQPLVSKGVFYFKKPDSLRWEYKSPVRSVLLMHNGETRRFLEGRDGVREDHGPGVQGMQVVMGEISLWLSGHFGDNPDFKATVEDNGSDRIDAQVEISFQIHQPDRVVSLRSSRCHSIRCSVRGRGFLYHHSIREREGE